MHSIFSPDSPQARAVASLWWWMFGVGGVIWLAVIAAMIVAVRARRGRLESDALTHVTPGEHHRVERTVAAATFVTVLILAAFLVYDFGVGRAIAQHPETALTIDVTGHQWWWE